jgi:regulator of PEP synthase PpsR (kinase-PPPase family)
VIDVTRRSVVETAAAIMIVLNERRPHRVGARW